MTGSESRVAVAMDRHVLHEVGQLMRALEANGPRTEEELALLVGAAYWERDRFRSALVFAQSSGMVHQRTSGLLTVAS